MNAIEEIPTPDPRSFDDATRPFAEAISDRYVLKRLIGSGGMGVVYLARDVRLNRLVAIKTLPPNLAKDSSLRERFLRETRTAGGMSHPNIVPIHGADEIDNHVFFVMGFVDGDSLAAHVRAHGRLAPRTVAGYLRDVALALDHAHTGGIIHRDIKAENILIDRKSGRALVTDFGIARVADATPLTGTGQLLGTVYYVSPEQVSGEPVDARSDIYSLGVVGYLALAGQFPFDADVASAVLVAHVTKSAPPLAFIARDVPPVLASIIDRCLMKDPAHRYASAGELVAALERATAELDRTDAPFTGPKLVSETEAHAVWKRAAELQAQTGIQPRPAAIPRPRDESKDRLRASGFGVEAVKAAASEAGIPEPYIEHALVEHGLRPATHPAPPAAASAPARPAPMLKRSFIAGVPLIVRHELRVDGEVDGYDFDRLLNVVRESTGRMGRTSAFTRELAWRTGMRGARLSVAVVPQDGVTNVEVERSLHRAHVVSLLLIMSTIGMFLGIGVGAIFDEMLGRGGEPVTVMAGFATGLSATLYSQRFVMRRFRARLDNAARKLAERIAAKVRESIG